MSPEFWVACGWWVIFVFVLALCFAARRGDKQVDPAREDAEVAFLEELWSLPAREHL